jgi:hypothetical protein
MKSSPVFARTKHESQSIASVSSTWKAPYDLPVGPNDVPFAPF